MSKRNTTSDALDEMKRVAALGGVYGDGTVQIQEWADALEPVVNAHDDLLAALKALADWCDNIPDSAGVLDGFGDVMDHARAAIAKAEGVA